MSLSVEDLRSDVTETSRHRMQLFLRGVEMLGAESKKKLSGPPHVKIQGTNIPKSAITISDSESFVRYSMFSGLEVWEIGLRSNTENVAGNAL